MKTAEKTVQPESFDFKTGEFTFVRGDYKIITSTTSKIVRLIFPDGRIIEDRARNFTENNARFSSWLYEWLCNCIYFIPCEVWSKPNMISNSFSVSGIQYTIEQDQRFGNLRLLLPPKIVVCYYNDLYLYHPELENWDNGILKYVITEYMKSEKGSGNSTTFIPEERIVGRSTDDSENIHYYMAYRQDGMFYLSLESKIISSNIHLLEEAVPGITEMQNGILFGIVFDFLKQVEY